MKEKRTKDVMVQIQTKDDMWFWALMTEAEEKGWLGSSTSELNETKGVFPTGTTDFLIMPTYHLHLWP